MALWFGKLVWASHVFLLLLLIFLLILFLIHINDEIKSKSKIKSKKLSHAPQGWILNGNAAAGAPFLADLAQQRLVDRKP